MSFNDWCVASCLGSKVRFVRHIVLVSVQSSEGSCCFDHLPNFSLVCFMFGALRLVLLGNLVFQLKRLWGVGAVSRVYFVVSLIDS
jgi:hypothetical protein